jgi:hypothetical protein
MMFVLQVELADMMQQRRKKQQAQAAALATQPESEC